MFTTKRAPVSHRKIRGFPQLCHKGFQHNFHSKRTISEGACTLSYLTMFHHLQPASPKAAPLLAPSHKGSPLCILVVVVAICCGRKISVFQEIWGNFSDVRFFLFHVPPSEDSLLSSSAPAPITCHSPDRALGTDGVDPGRPDPRRQ